MLRQYLSRFLRWQIRLRSPTIKALNDSLGTATIARWRGFRVEVQRVAQLVAAIVISPPNVAFTCCFSIS